MLYDLHGAGAITRVISLAVLGITFYVAGLINQRMTSAPETTS